MKLPIKIPMGTVKFLRGQGDDNRLYFYIDGFYFKTEKNRHSFFNRMESFTYKYTEPPEWLTEAT